MRRPGSVLLADLAMVLVWTALAVLAGAVVWNAVARLGQGGLLTTGRPLAPSQVLRALDHTHAPPMSSVPLRTPRPATAAQPTARSWRLPGGTAAASCRGPAAELLYAAPADGWTYRLAQGSGRVLVVDFTGPGGLSRLVVRCVAGVPARVPTAVPPTQSTPSAPPADDGAGEDAGD